MCSQLSSYKEVIERFNYVFHLLHGISERFEDVLYIKDINCLFAFYSNSPMFIK